MKHTERYVWVAMAAFVVGFIIGANLILDGWKDSAKRGMFEVGHVVYRAEPVR